MLFTYFTVSNIWHFAPFLCVCVWLCYPCTWNIAVQWSCLILLFWITVTFGVLMINLYLICYMLGFYCLVRAGKTTLSFCIGFINWPCYWLVITCYSLSLKKQICTLRLSRQSLSFHIYFANPPRLTILLWETKTALRKTFSEYHLHHFPLVIMVIMDFFFCLIWSHFSPILLMITALCCLQAQAE